MVKVKGARPDLCSQRHPTHSLHEQLCPQPLVPPTTPSRDLQGCPPLPQNSGTAAVLGQAQGSRGCVHAAAGASTCLCSWAAAGESIGSAGMFVLSQEGLAFQKRREREQRKNWKGSRRK